MIGASWSTPSSVLRKIGARHHPIFWMVPDTYFFAEIPASETFPAKNCHLTATIKTL